MAERTFAVMDAGGTTLRTGLFRPEAGELAAVRRVPTAGIGAYHGLPVDVLQHQVVEQLVEEARRALDGGGEALAVAFAGPVTAGGDVLAAPTIWGAGGVRLPLARLLAERLGVSVVVVNDLTAAVWRYVGHPDDQPFCLITVSSGIGNKVYWGGRVLLDDDGYGGELGHWRCRSGPAAPLCDCGGRGHLGAIASGRGVLAAARAAGRDDPAAYSRSLLARSCPDASKLTNETLTRAVRHGDGFATEVLLGGLRELAAAMTAVFTAIGVRRFRVIGGFALAIGETYARLLTGCLREAGCFGLPPGELDRLVVLGEADDDHSLIGAGRLLARVPA